MKRIAYIATDSGIDGREKTRIAYAFWSERERDDHFDEDKNKDWKTKGELIVDEAVQKNQALAKLDGLDRLAIGLSAPLT